MKRRDFILTSLALLPASGALAKAALYTPGLVEAELAAGKTVFLDFKAQWCGTCKAQERQITALKQENPAYEAAISFIDVDWDQFRKSDLVKRLNVPRRSTLVVLKGNEELGRIVAGTARSQIKELMDTALSAATTA
ncbi:MAG: thioredoxin family protein [Pseudomonadota bacterium]